MIFNNPEGPIQDVWDEEDSHMANPTPEQQKDELLRQAHIGLEKLRIQELELINLGIPNDVGVKLRMSRVKEAIEKQEQLVVSLGGELEVREK